MRHHVVRPDVKSRPKVTTEDLRILQILASGGTNQDVAEAFSVSTATVGRWLTTLFEKIGARDRTHAAVVAVKSGLLKDTELALPFWVMVELTATREPLRHVG